MMKKISKINIILMVAALFSSCLDMYDEEPQQILGNLYWRKSAGDKSAFLIFGKNYRKDGTYNVIINEPIIATYGNDSIMYVKSRFMTYTNHYYLLMHRKGEAILKLNEIDSVTYNNATRGQKFEYQYIE